MVERRGEDSITMVASSERALALAGIGRVDDAVLEARRLVEERFEDPEAHAVLAAILLQAGVPGEADEVAKQGLERAPDHSVLLRLRGRSAHRRGDLPDALRWMRASLAAEPRDFFTHCWYSDALFAFELPEEGWAALEEARRLAPEDRAVRARFAEAWLARDPARAEPLLRELLAEDPSNAAVLNDLAVALQRQSRHEEAALLFRAALGNAPGSRLIQRNTYQALRGLVQGSSARLAWSAFTSTRALTIAITLPGWWRFALTVAFSSALVVLLLEGRLRRRVSSLDPELQEVFRKLLEDGADGE